MPIKDDVNLTADDWTRIDKLVNQVADAQKSPAELAGRRVSSGPRSQRMYASAIPNRFNQGFPSYNLSADAEMVTSLRNLRSRSRQLIRDAAYAKSAKRAVVNNVIGTGIKVEPSVKNSRGTLNTRVNHGVREAFHEWCHAPRCHTGGEMHFHDLERQLMGQVFEAGEIFVRMWPQKFGDSTVPLGLEVIEPERIADGYAQPAGAHWENLIRMGIEVDEFKRPVAYWIRDLHPGDIRLNIERTDHYTRVPAEDIIHLKVIDRWPQTRGEPWMHAIARKLADMDGYSEAEIIAARGAANYMGTIETSESVEIFGERGADNTVQIQMEPGAMFKLAPGEKLNMNAPNRPNSGVEPFMRLMLREISAGLGISYEVTSHDYSQANYSSSRLSLLDERDVWKSLQMWFIRTFRHRLHKRWLQAAVLSGSVPEIAMQDYALDAQRFESVVFRPRGWQWIDPTKEVTAYKEAVKGGMITVGQVIAQTAGGDDIEDLMEARSAELEYFQDKNLVFDTSPDVYVPAESRGQVLLDKNGLPAPAAVVSAQGMKDAGLTPPPAGMGAPGAQAQPGQQPNPDAAELQPKPKPKAPESPDVTEDEGDRSGRLRLIKSQRGF